MLLKSFVRQTLIFIFSISAILVNIFFQDKVLQRKNQSADNLLNFHYMPLRSQYGGNVSNNGFRRRRTTTFNKEAFLQAK